MDSKSAKRCERHDLRFLFERNEELIDIGSTDYLGMGSHPRLKTAAATAIERYGTAGHVRLLAGDGVFIEELEATCSSFFCFEDTLTFSSGFSANLGLFRAIGSKRILFVVDRLAHASVIDGIIGSGGKLIRYGHRDVEHLEYLMTRNRARFDEAFIVTDGVFSMDGTVAPLQEICSIAEIYSAKVIVDDCHGVGTLADGKGVVGMEDCQNKVFAMVGTFSKAFGSTGGFVCSSKSLKSRLVNNARSFFFSAASSPASYAASNEALKIFSEGEAPLAAMKHNLYLLRKAAVDAGFEVVGDSDAPLFAIITGSSGAALNAARKFRELGVYAPPIRPPTVPSGGARLRVTASASLSSEDIGSCISAIFTVGDEVLR